MKPGYRTSEFWLAIVFANLAVFKEHIVPGLPVELIMVAAGPVLAYVLGRSWIKARNS